jgi:site-specific recombinase XerD
MNLSKAVEGYIAHKRSLGMAFRSEAVRLHAFVKAVGNCDMRFIKPIQVRQYLDGTGPVTYFCFSKYHTLTAFYRYAIARGYCSKSPLPINVPVKPEKFQAYIYTNRDMKRLIEAADSRHRHVWLLEPSTVRTLLLLLYGSGLRISEALHLRIADFDADAGVLTIRETKFFKSRFVPVGRDLARVLCDYMKRQWAGRTQTDATHFSEPIKASRFCARQQNSCLKGCAKRPACCARRKPDINRGCMTSAIHLPSFASSLGIAKAKTYSDSCLIYPSTSDMRGSRIHNAI